MLITKNNDVAVIVPAYNEAIKLPETLNDLLSYFCNIILVDDGSVDNTAEKALIKNVLVIKHPINLGQGAALQTGITKALQNQNIKYILTFDADGQHSINSALKMIGIAKDSNVDIVLGTRFQNNFSKHVPKLKLLILKLGILYTRINTGLKVTDTHNGLRVMTRDFAEGLAIKKSGMAHASEILSHIKNVKAKWIEIPVEIYYTSYSKAKGQSILNAINILTEMIHK